MTEFDKVLELPVDDLKERRRVLEEELSKTIVELVSSELKKELKELFSEYGIQDVSRVTWDYHGEYDDEGGTYWAICDIDIELKNGDSIDKNEYSVKRTPSWSNGATYTYYLEDDLHELLSGYHSDLYEYDINEIILD
jgi:hypothetical protein